MTGSAQQQRYLLYRHVDDMPLEDAAAQAGLTDGEARLIDQAVARGELSKPEARHDLPLSGWLAAARRHLGTDEAKAHEAAVLPLRAAHAPTRECATAPAGPSRLLAAITPPPEAAIPTNEGETAMPRKPANGQSAEEIKAPDFERAVKIYRHDIKPANEKSGEHAQAASTAYKAIKKECRVNTRAAKFVFQLAGESEEKRNDVLRSIRGLLGAMHIGITDDLVSRAEGEDNGAAIIPQADAKRPELATVQ